MSREKKELHVLSIDFDGCLSGGEREVDIKQSLNALEGYHRTLIAAIRSRYPVGGKIDLEIFVGSARQSFMRDFWCNAVNRNGSCFPVFAEIASLMGAKFNRFLLSDICFDVDPGHNMGVVFRCAERLKLNKPGEYDRTHYIYNTDCYSGEAKNPIFKNPELHDLYQLSRANYLREAFFDAEDKINLVYAQMHKVATAPGVALDDPIVLHFFDDRIDILWDLAAFFGSYKYLIPSNVTLKFFEYSAKSACAPFSFDTADKGIQGTGLPDLDYINTVKDMAIIAMDHYRLLVTQGHASATMPIFRYAHFLTPEKLIELKTLRNSGQLISVLPPLVRPAVPSVLAPVMPSEFGLFANSPSQEKSNAEPRVKKPRYEGASAPLSSEEPTESEQIPAVETNLLT